MSRALGEGAEITYQDSDGDTALHLAATHGLDDVLKTLIEMGIDVNIRNGSMNRWTALITAAYCGKISCLKILLENGADPEF